MLNHYVSYEWDSSVVISNITYYKYNKCKFKIEYWDGTQWQLIEDNDNVSNQDSYTKFELELDSRIETTKIRFYAYESMNDKVGIGGIQCYGYFEN